MMVAVAMAVVLIHHVVLAGGTSMIRRLHTVFILLGEIVADYEDK